jgi:hypothetical protein
MITGFSKGRELDHKNGDRTHQEHVHHAALVKKNRQHKPNQKEYSRYKPKFHVSPFFLRSGFIQAAKHAYRVQASACVVATAAT